MYEILNVHVKIIGWSQEIDMVRQIWIYGNKQSQEETVKMKVAARIICNLLLKDSLADFLKY